MFQSAARRLRALPRRPLAVLLLLLLLLVLVLPLLLLLVADLDDGSEASAIGFAPLFLLLLLLLLPSSGEDEALEEERRRCLGTKHVAAPAVERHAAAVR